MDGRLNQTRGHGRSPPSIRPAIAAKLRAPSAPQHLIHRHRPLELLDHHARRITLLSAPAGSGKTVLLGTWATHPNACGPVCWLTLDADDNDASRLAADLLAALASVEIEPSDALSNLVPPIGARVEEFLPSFVNGLDGLRSPTLLVLDDVHELTSPQAVAILDFIVRYAPERLRMVLAGRSDPPLPIERLRVSDALGELRADQLAFDRIETGELCRRLHLSLSSEQVDDLWRRTEGWAAALCLSALSLQEHSEPAGFLAGLAGTEQPIADYLVSEVLAHVSEDWREFMLRTSIVEVITPELADRLTGLEGSGRPMLERLTHSGAPLQSLSPVQELQRYRYHPLFRELLRAHLQHAHPDEVPYLYRRAARWYAERGQTTQAIENALAGEDWLQAEKVIAENAIDLLLMGGLTGVGASLRQFPDELVAASPRLAVVLAGVCLQEGDLERARSSLTLARRACSHEHRDEKLDAAIAIVALWHARLCGRLEDAIRYAKRLTLLARACQEIDRVRLTAFAHTGLGATYLWSGDPEAAQPELLAGLALAREHDMWPIAIDCLAQLSLIHYLHGELAHSQQLCHQAHELAAGRGSRTVASIGYLLFASAVVAYEHGELDAARTSLGEADPLLLVAEPAVRYGASLLHALILAIEDGSPAADGLLKLSVCEASIADREPLAPSFERAAQLVKARVLIAADDLEHADELLGEAALHPPTPSQLLVLSAKLAIKRNRPEQALVALERVCAPDAVVHPSLAVEAWLLTALAQETLGRGAVCADALEHSLALAERAPFRAAFLNEPASTRRLLERHALSSSRHPALVEVLLDATAQRSRARVALAEPLTGSEQRVLRYLPTMLSNAEIGAEMYVSRNTIKTHLRSIYRKLGVDSRSHAVERARGLGLLPAGIKRRR